MTPKSTEGSDESGHAGLGWKAMDVGVKGMPSSWQGDHRATALSVLVVSEDPFLIVEAQRTLGPHGVRVSGCLGPAQTPCILDVHDVCPLAGHASVVIVDAPKGGSFSLLWRNVPAGEYATRLAGAHPRCLVILGGAPQGLSGFSGEVAHATNARSALAILRQVLSIHRPAAKVFADRAAQRR